jgi:ParB family chromosome partitioning protein
MSKLTEMVKNSGSTAGAEIIAKMYKPRDIGTDPEIAGIFKIHEETLKTVTASIVKNGYDQSQPVVIWKGKNVIVDGHTRLRAAIEAGVHEIPGVEKEFETLEDAQRYTFKRQAERRNLTQAELFQAAVTLGIKDNHDGSGRSSEKLAEELGVSAATITHARTVSEKASEEDIDAIKNGEKTINEVYQKVRQKKDKIDSALMLHPSPLVDRITEENGENTGSPDIEDEGTGADTEPGGNEINDPLSGDIGDIEETFTGKTEPEPEHEIIQEIITFLSENNEKRAAQLVSDHYLPMTRKEDIEGIHPPVEQEER